MPMNGGRYELRFSGAGGQGVILAAVIYAEAAGVHDGKYVCQSQSYGPEARGGSSRADVVISDQPIDYPRATGLDLLLAMNQASCDAFVGDLKPGGLLVVDAGLVREIPPCRAVAIPFSEIALQTAQTPMAANMVALGSVGVLGQGASLKALEAVLKVRVPKGTEAVNLKAFRAGVRAGRKAVPPDAVERWSGDEVEM